MGDEHKGLPQNNTDTQITAHFKDIKMEYGINKV